MIKRLILISLINLVAIPNPVLASSYCNLKDLRKQERVASQRLNETRIHVAYRTTLIAAFGPSVNDVRELRKEEGQLAYYSRRLEKIRSEIRSCKRK